MSHDRLDTLHHDHPPLSRHFSVAPMIVGAVGAALHALDRARKEAATAQ